LPFDLEARVEKFEKMFETKNDNNNNNNDSEYQISDFEISSLFERLSFNSSRKLKTFERAVLILSDRVRKTHETKQT